MSPQQPTPSPVAVPDQPAPDAGQRLAQQLQTLSQVVETLTYRLLELEERLTVQDQRLQEFSEAGRPELAISAAAHGRLEDTEERLQRIESLLTGTAEVHDIDGPFPEEPEQPFLDELEAVAEPTARHGSDFRGFLTA
jgi:hypothetical protein